MSIIIFPHLIRRETVLQCVTENEFDVIENYKRRVEQIHSTKVKNREIPFARVGYGSNGNIVSYNNNVPDIDHILALAVRFRLLFAEKEPTRFEKVVNIVRRRAIDEWAQNYIEHLRMSYQSGLDSSDTSEGLGAIIANRSIISLWFNSEFFHSDAEKRQVLDGVNECLGEKGSLFHLYVAMMRCCVEIDRLYTVLHRFERLSPLIYTPDHHFS